MEEEEAEVKPRSGSFKGDSEWREGGREPPSNTDMGHTECWNAPDTGDSWEMPTPSSQSQVLVDTGLPISVMRSVMASCTEPPYTPECRSLSLHSTCTGQRLRCCAALWELVVIV